MSTTDAAEGPRAHASSATTPAPSRHSTPPRRAAGLSHPTSPEPLEAEAAGEDGRVLLDRHRRPSLSLRHDVSEATVAGAVDDARGSPEDSPGLSALPASHLPGMPRGGEDRELFDLLPVENESLDIGMGEEGSGERGRPLMRLSRHLSELPDMEGSDMPRRPSSKTGSHYGAAEVLPLNITISRRASELSRKSSGSKGKMLRSSSRGGEGRRAGAWGTHPGQMRDCNAHRCPGPGKQPFHAIACA